MANDLHSLIFLADDDEFILNLYKMQLQKIGFSNVKIFTHPEDMLNSLAENPSIIFVDYSKPNCGLTALNQIKKYNPSIYVIFISGTSSKEELEKTLESGAFDYIVKADNDLNKIHFILTKILNISQYLEKGNGANLKNLFNLFL